TRRACRHSRPGATHPRSPPRVGALVVATTRHGRSIVATRSGRRLWRRDALPFPRAVLSPDGARLLVPPASGSPGLVDARTGVEAPTGLPPRSRVTTVAFGRDGAAAY